VVQYLYRGGVTHGDVPGALTCNAAEAVCMTACMGTRVVDPTTWLALWLVVSLAVSAILLKTTLSRRDSCTSIYETDSSEGTDCEATTRNS
jgi:hypothetical protein